MMPEKLEKRNLPDKVNLGLCFPCSIQLEDSLKQKK